jgi:Leucine-rich repeat (LRR) protein
MSQNYIKSYIYTIIFCVLFTSCGGSDPEDDIPTPDPITIFTSLSTISLPAVGGEQYFTVTTNTDNWTVSSSDNWLSVTKEGNRVKIQGEANINASRTATIRCIVTGKDISSSVSVSQNKVTNIQGDSLALVDFSKLGVSWNLAKGMDQWDGVEIEGGRVTSIKLVSNGIKGNLPASIGRLTSLQYLDLSGNELSGNIPSEMNNLGQLEFLDLSNNNISGSAPSLNALSKLVLLDLSSNKLTSLPNLHQNLESLEYLAVNNNEISGTLPSSWSKYKKVIYLDASSNSFSGSIPNEWAAFSKMRVFHLYMNSLSGTMPDYISSFNALKSLALNHNNFTGNIPVGLGNIPALEDLWLLQNRMNGTVPASLLTNSHWEAWKNNITPQQSGYGFSNVKSIHSRKSSANNTSLSNYYKSMYHR